MREESEKGSSQKAQLLVSRETKARTKSFYKQLVGILKLTLIESHGDYLFHSIFKQCKSCALLKQH